MCMVHPRTSHPTLNKIAPDEELPDCMASNPLSGKEIGLDPDYYGFYPPESLSSECSSSLDQRLRFDIRDNVQYLKLPEFDRSTNTWY